MQRLIDRGLMFGNLLRVDSPVLVDRYRRALRHLTGLDTQLDAFHIDISGYSPEIGDELGNDRYLNQDGVNRRFILLSTEQHTAPLLNSMFSTSRGVLRQFIEANQSQLFALTAQDAVAGELVNSVLAVDTPARLLDIRRITVEADTTRRTVHKAEELGQLITRFRSERDAWWDDRLIAQMIDLSADTGDVIRNPVSLPQMGFEQADFWTAHFGGLFLFRSVPHPAVVYCGDRVSGLPLPVVSLQDRSAIAKFLQLNRLTEQVVEARGIDGVAVLQQKMDFMVADVASAAGHDLTGATRRDLRMLARGLVGRLPREWQGLAALVRWAEAGGDWPHIDSDHPAYFYSLRAAKGPNADLVNMLLAVLCPLDPLHMFTFHKQAFYEAYASWPEAKRAYIADALARDYAADKVGTRDRLFGHHDTDGPWGRAPVSPKRDKQRDIVDLVGPWGALRRGT